MISRKFTDTDPYTFAEFCNKYQKFKIPSFQRAYKWKSKQINDLWESVKESEEGYFIGNIVCLEPTEESDGRAVIIDGQQRLFTISLVLAAIKNKYREIKTKNVADRERASKSAFHIDKFLYFTEIYHPYSESLKIYPGKQNLREIYEGLVNGTFNLDDKIAVQNLDDNQKIYVANYKIIKKLVGDYVQGDEFNRLDELQRKFTNLVFIAIVCRSDNDAYQIFEGLNNTGIGLSVADLVKNSVLQYVRGEETKILVEGNWEEIEKLFEKNNISHFAKFLRHQWISENGYISTNQLFEAIKTSKLKGRSNEDIIQYTKDLLKDAQIYVALRYAENENYLSKKFTKKVKELLSRFRFLDLDQIYELLLSYVKKYEKEITYSETQFLHDVEKIWIFAFRAKVITVSPPKYERLFAEQCLFVKNYDKKTHMERMSTSFINDLRKLVDNDEDFKEKFIEEVGFREGGDNSFLRFILDCILRSENPNIRVNDPTIEHIFPKEPSMWSFTKEESRGYVNKIGNILILYDNDNKLLSNKPFEEKVKEVYEKSHFKLVNIIGTQYPDFASDPKGTIEKRSEDLAKIANKIWAFN